MNLTESLELINSFFNETIEFGKEEDSSTSSSLEQEKGITLPPELKNYIDKFAPASNFYFTCIGNSLGVYAKQRLSWLMDGYNYNSASKEPIKGWRESWFIFSDEGADPIIVKLNEQEKHSKVYKAMHGAGKWEFRPIADSIGQFLVCAAATHHALCGFNLEDSIIDDRNGFNLAEEPASWLFPFIHKHASKYYEEWVSVFENSNIFPGD
ncbi:SMI1/KNR4 family protein [Microbulbifer sp. OS29]|uniref:SMI1/KNR4 family protein n=1 Tax=Microbulbifer okhotskensis TaxID=2926617 RepID=A0A9X2J675_9GAMM|nr:SMI1/KNR4 family protein [Microbulbifer okhotskensis]MCO1336342.1 SMI1/KNR4 family protein [Microbulbifer okhotskensis]